MKVKIRQLKRLIRECLNESTEIPEHLKPYIDQARDWVNLNKPELDGEEHDRAVLQFASELYDEDLDENLF